MRVSFNYRTKSALSIAGLVLIIGALDASPYCRTLLQHLYGAWYRVISHRMCEATVAVLSFATAGLFFSIVVALTGRKLDTSKYPSIGTFEVRRWTLSTFANNFWFWAAVNTGLYLGLIEVSQRLLGDTLQPLHHADLEAPSFTRMAVEVAFSVWAYDFIFWWIHRSWHTATPPSILNTAWSRRLWHTWRALHHLHHDHYAHSAAPLSVMNTFHHHFMDAAAQVGINIIVQQIPLAFLFPGPRHKLSKLLHNVVVTWLLVEAHSGVDCWFMSHRLFPTIFGGSVRHQIHHQVGRIYFHQFFKYLDDWGCDERSIQSKTT
jgi:hypothetical protein